MFHHPMYQPHHHQQAYVERYHDPHFNDYHKNQPTMHHHEYYVEDSNRSKSAHKKRHHHRHRSKSLSKLNTIYTNDDYQYNENDPYYSHQTQHQHYHQNINNNNQQFDSRSTTPFSENTTNRRHRHYHNSINRRQQQEEDNRVIDYNRRHAEVQLAPFVHLGNPMTMHPMTNNGSYHHHQEGLGVCATETNCWLPPSVPVTTTTKMNDLLMLPPQTNIAAPMIQPPFFIQPQIPNNSNGNYFSSSLATSYYPPLAPQQYQQNHLVPTIMPMPTMPNIFSDLFRSTAATTLASSTINTMGNTATDNNQQAAVISTPILTSRPVTPLPTAAATNVEPTSSTRSIATSTQQQRPVVQLRRKKSFMEGILSTLSLLGDDNITYYHHPNQINHTEKVVNDMESSGLTSLSSVTTTTTTEGGGRDISNNESNINNQSTTATSYYNNSAPSKKSSPKNSPERGASLSRKTSLKLFKKANALQNRPYIWCYRPFSAQQKEEVEAEENKSSPDAKAAVAAAPTAWTAFDVKNQIRLDNQYAVALAKISQQVDLENLSQPQQQQQQEDNNGNKALKITDDPSLIITLEKQSNLFSPVMVSIKDGLAWYYTKSNQAQKNNELEYELLEISYLPTHYNRLVVSNNLLNKEEEEINTLPPREQRPSLRRAKSMDGGFTSRVLNTVLSW